MLLSLKNPCGEKFSAFCLRDRLDFWASSVRTRIRSICQPASRSHLCRSGAEQGRSPPCSTTTRTGIRDNRTRYDVCNSFSPPISARSWMHTLPVLTTLRILVAGPLIYLYSPIVRSQVFPFEAQRLGASSARPSLLIFPLLPTIPRGRLVT